MYAIRYKERNSSVFRRVLILKLFLENLFVVSIFLH